MGLSQTAIPFSEDDADNDNDEDYGDNAR